MAPTPASADAEAADWLERQLAQLDSKLDGLIRTRTAQHNVLLGDPGSDNWSGPRRDGFETDFDTEQAALHGLKKAAASLRSSVHGVLEKIAKENY